MEGVHNNALLFHACYDESYGHTLCYSAPVR